VRRGEASRRRGTSVRLRVSRLRLAYAPALRLLAGRGPSDFAPAAEDKAAEGEAQTESTDCEAAYG
jgi:hypothetical protein